MVIDTDLQVWLEGQAGANGMVMIPYVKTVEELELSYHMEVIQEGGAGIYSFVCPRSDTTPGQSR